MVFDFDRLIDRRNTNSIKWKRYPADVLPLWVADMDFAAPEPILSALREKVEHGVHGYEMPTRELREVVAERMRRLYNWQVTADMVVATPGVVAGFNVAARMLCEERKGVVVQPPVYPPFLKVHENWGLLRQEAPLTAVMEGSTLRYQVDFDGFESAMNSAGAETGMFLLCNPHNPTGQVYRREELTRMAEICLKSKAVICSDEIHSELLLGGSTHVPIGSLSPEVAEQTITLIAPSKTFNIPGLFCGFAIIPNKSLRERYKRTLEHLTMHVNSFGLAGAQVAYSGACDDWLAALQEYLTANRETLLEFIRQNLGQIRATVPDATFLAWLDCNELVQSGSISGTPAEFFLQKARVGLNEGADFGSQGKGFVRLNFGCPRSTLMQALEKIKTSLSV